jgi:hypothetical protein
LKPLKNKGFKEKRITKVGWYAIGKSTPLESNKSQHCILMEGTTSLSNGGWARAVDSTLGGA